MKRRMIVGFTVAGLAAVACASREVDLGGADPIGNASSVASAGSDGVDEPALAAPGSCTAHAQTAYRLIERRNLASPLRDPRGGRVRR
jgi:hypothetical protein